MSHFTVAGRRFETPESFTLGEARDMKQICGLAVAELQGALKKGDPEAVAAFLYITWRRQDPSVTLEDVWAIDLGEVVFEAAADEGAAADVPPAETPLAPADSAEPASASPSSGTTPEPSGHPV